MSTNNFYRSDLYRIHNIVQNSMTLYPKELVVAQLRDFFSRDQWYVYKHDFWGYPLTPDHTNLPPDAGLNDDSTTRLFIGEQFTFRPTYYPSIVVRHGGSTSVPISFNRENANVQWGTINFEDGYGNLVATFPNPEYFIFAGAYEGSINIDINTRDLRARDDLVDLVSLLFIDIAFDDLVKSGLIVKNVSSGAPTQTQDRNDYIFSQTITLQIRSEWRRNVPINNIIDIINTSIEFGRTDPEPGLIAKNLTINTNQTITDIISKL
jgi:hypothetical protein